MDGPVWPLPGTVVQRKNKSKNNLRSSYVLGGFRVDSSEMENRSIWKHQEPTTKTNDLADFIL